MSKNLFSGVSRYRKCRSNKYAEALRCYGVDPTFETTDDYSYSSSASSVRSMLSDGSSIHARVDEMSWSDGGYVSDGASSPTWSIEATDGNETSEESRQGWARAALVLEPVDIAWLEIRVAGRTYDRSGARASMIL